MMKKDPVRPNILRETVGKTSHIIDDEVAKDETMVGLNSAFVNLDVGSVESKTDSDISGRMFDSVVYRPWYSRWWRNIVKMFRKNIQWFGGK